MAIVTRLDYRRREQGGGHARLATIGGSSNLAGNGCVRHGLAQSAAQPDKSQYTLFDPVPDQLMRNFNTDRPPKANSPYTVDAGHF
jgi:hypothetical protein